MTLDEPVAKCQHCGYLMHPPFGNWNLCPECGKLVQPHVAVHRGGALAFGGAVCAAFAVTVVVGDSNRTVAAALLSGDPLVGGATQSTAWLGFAALLLASAFRTVFGYVALTGSGLALLLTAGTFILVNTHAHALTLATAAPFLLLSLLLAFRIVDLSRTQRETSSRPE